MSDVHEPTVGVRLGRADDLAVGEGRAFVVDGEQVAVFLLRSGALRAVSAVCPHAGGPIADGQVDESVVVCPLHLHVFDLAGGTSTTGAPPLRTYRAWTDEDGWVVVAGRDPVPDG